MIKQMKLGYTGMSKDLSKDKQSQRYYNAKNIRILATDQPSSFAVTNEHGNELVFQIPTPVFNRANTSIDYTVGTTNKSLGYTITTGDPIPRNELEENYHPGAAPALTSGPQVIIGTKDLRDSAIIITTDDNGFDCFWELINLNNGNFDLELKYMNNMGLSKNNLIQIEYNYENSLIEKIYFVDGNHQLRFMNLRQSVDNGDNQNLIDVESSNIDSVSTFEVSQVTIDSIIDGGDHTSGMIQYAYNLYVLNGSQTRISPLSPLEALDKGDGLGGGEVNEVVGKTVVVNIPNIDDKFSHIRLYSIKYTSLNEQPEVSLIADREIDNFDSFTYYDDGAIIESLSLEAFTFLGSDPIVPKHIAAKDSRLFYINVKELNFDVDLDMRAYAHDAGGNITVWENVSVSGTTLVGAETIVNPATYDLGETHDSINRDYDTYMFAGDGITHGGEGKYIRLTIDQNNLLYDEAKELRFFKDREVYRLAIEFYNNRGQVSNPKWIMDMKMPEGNLAGNYNQLRVELKPEFYVWLNTSSNFTNEDDKPVGFRILRADRQLSDRTIICQGMINPFVANFRGDSKAVSFNDRRGRAIDTPNSKMPSMTRVFNTIPPFVKCKNYHDLSWPSENSNSLGEMSNDPDRETHSSGESGEWRAQTLQYNHLMQMFSPEIMFENVIPNAGMRLNVVGLQESDFYANWSAEINPNNNDNEHQAKFINKFTISTPGGSIQTMNGLPDSLHDHSYFGPPDNDSHPKGLSQIYRQFRGGFHTNNGVREYDIYGTPEVSDRGADFKSYNNNPLLRYSNHLKTLLQDYWSHYASNDAEVQMHGVSSEGAKCVVFAEGDDDPNTDIRTRKSIEELYNATGISETNGILISELIRGKNTLYTGNIYNGNSYESKSIATYIPCGLYTDINSNNTLIESPGDTYVHNYTFTKLVKTDIEDTSEGTRQVTEIVSFPVETTVDLENRNDISNQDWDNRYHPKYEEFQQYNRVYSQQNTTEKNTSPGFKFKKVKSFDTRIMASKEKIPGENIDNWTDLLINETMDLDGKYGPINAVTNFRDEIYTLQDTGVAHLSINPRVQTTGSDGIEVQLGTGQILHDYQYLTTSSGCLNKWGVINTQNGFYYFDLLNKTLVAYQGGIKGISDEEGFHSFFTAESDYSTLSIDNPVLNTGVSCGYNSVNNDVYFSFHKSADKFTISYNEATRSFVSFYDYAPAWYINKGSRMITTNPGHNQVWEHFRGLRNYFYGKYYPSSITFNASPQGDGDHIFNNLHYKMEMTDPSGQDLPLIGLNQVRVWNDYQDSGVVNLVLRDNVNRKFRHWKLNLPRNKGSRDRIRNPWAFIQLILNDDDANKMVLHDLTLHYTEY